MCKLAQKNLHFKSKYTLLFFCLLCNDVLIEIIKIHGLFLMLLELFFLHICYEHHAFKKIISYCTPTLIQALYLIVANKNKTEKETQF